MSMNRTSVLGGVAAVVTAFAAGMVVAGEQKKADSPALTAAKELVVASGSARAFDAVMPTMMAQFEPLFLKMAPGHEKEVKEVLSQLMTEFSARKGEILDVIAGIYAEKLTEVDLKELAKFFSDGAGKRFIEKQPEIVKESMLAGQKWGESIGRELEGKVRDELKKRGIKI